MGDFKKLVVWRRAYAIALRAYRVVAAFPAAERFELSAQIRKAAVSIAANIAEGSGRLSDRDQAHFYQMALGSSRELECLLLLARDLRYVSGEDNVALARDLDESQRMLTALIRRSRATLIRPVLASRR